MDLRRVRYGEWIAGVSGAVLLITLFLPWYSSAAGDSENAWQAFGFVDVVLMLAALMGIGLATAAATQRSAAVPQTVGALTVPVAFLAAILVVIRALSLPTGADGREAGLYIGIVATLGVLVGAWRSIGDDRFPREATKQVEVTPLPAPQPRSEPISDE
jgi:hypothetical protein